MKSKLHIIIQARNTSSRLPSKVVLPLGSSTNLEQMLKRVSKIENSEITIATTINKEDDLIVEIANNHNINVFRGSEINVLERFYQAAQTKEIENIIRLTGDCPCLDTNLLKKFIDFHFNNHFDFSSTGLKRTFPHGLIEAEVFNIKMLKEAFENAKESFEIEHVTPYFYKTKVDKYKIGSFEDNKISDIRLTLDTKEDYLLIRLVYDFLGENFGLNEVEKLFIEKPYLKAINANISQKEFFTNAKDEIEFAIKLLEKQDLWQAARKLQS